MNATDHNNSRLRIGVFTAWFKGDYQFEFVSGVEYEAKQHNIHVLYFTGRVPRSPYRNTAILFMIQRSKLRWTGLLLCRCLLASAPTKSLMILSLNTPPYRL
jgi:hypothetical protein